MRLKFEENQPGLEPGLEFAEFNFGFVKMEYSIENISDYVELWRVSLHVDLWKSTQREVLADVVGKEDAIKFAQNHFDNEARRVAD